MSHNDLLSTSELSFSGHSIIGALSRVEWEATSSNRLEETERKMKQPGGKSEPLEDAFSSRSSISIPYDSVGGGERMLWQASDSLKRNLFVGDCSAPHTAPT